VPRAVVTHGHGDHARPGNERVLATAATIAIMRARHGEAAGGVLQPLAYRQSVAVGEVRVTLVPAGHVLGSAQIMLEYRGSRVVVSGDYKRRSDPTCAPFEPCRCDVEARDRQLADRRLGPSCQDSARRMARRSS
jgi:putative mRNA 3-end processing factor